ncbi:MAG: PEP-utilizing enzyme [Tepidiformaceae bacterium]
MKLRATDDFHVAWDDPADAQLTWTVDQMHYPGPMPPLCGYLMAELDGRIMGTRTRLVNGYPYQQAMGIPDPPPEVAERGLAAVWNGDYVPRLRAFHDGMRAANFNSMTAPELAAALDGLVADAVEAFRLTMLVVLPFMMPTMELVVFAEAELGADGPLLVGTLLQGFANETASAGLGLAELATRAAANPELAAAVRAGRDDRLDGLPGGKEFVEAFDAYLDEFGWRAESWAAVEVPLWSEDRAVPLRLIARYLESPATAPAAAIARSADQRAKALGEAESRLQGEKLAQFRALLEAARSHVAMSEGRAHWQLTAIGLLRLPLVALGRKLAAAGVIDDPDDIFYLEWEEAKRLASQPEPMAALVRQRKDDLARWRTLEPAPFIGVPPGAEEAPPEMQLVMKHFFGMGGVASTREDVITGFGASRGTASGRARVVHSLAESDRLEPGEILVCSSTAAPWTPLFAIAAAVVTDSGGVLSHSAICAREYANPLRGRHPGRHAPHPQRRARARRWRSRHRAHRAPLRGGDIKAGYNSHFPA